MQLVTEKEVFLALLQSPLATVLAVRQNPLDHRDIEVRMSALVTSAIAIAGDWNEEVARKQKQEQNRLTL